MASIHVSGQLLVTVVKSKDFTHLRDPISPLAQPLDYWTPCSYGNHHSNDQQKDIRKSRMSLIFGTGQGKEDEAIIEQIVSRAQCAEHEFSPPHW